MRQQSPMTIRSERAAMLETLPPDRNLVPDATVAECLAAQVASIEDERRSAFERNAAPE
jgi:hypothetical protein